MQQVGLFWKLEGLSNEAVLDGLMRLVGSSRRMLAELLAHLSEVEQRRLHLDAGYPSMFVYCTSRLGLTEDEAYRRIEVARLARRAPIIFERIATGELTLSVVALLKPHADAPGFAELLDAVSGKSVQRAREALATRFPKPDVPPSIRKLPERAARPLHVSPMQRAPEAPASATTRASEPARPSRTIEPLSSERFKLQFTADAAFKKKLELARDLTRHAIPSGDIAALLDRALDLLIAEQMKRRFGKLASARGAKPRQTPASTATPPVPGAPAPAPGSSMGTESVHVDRSTRRALLERDGLRCTWHSDDGVRCEARAWIERDHILARARGGPATLENLRHLCRAHNGRAAELAFGRAHIERAIRARRATPTPDTAGLGARPVDG